MSKPKQHAKFAASSSDRWLNCPSSMVRSEGLPDEPESEAAIQGTIAHELMEYALNTNVGNVVKSFENEDEKFPLEMRKHVQGFVDFVRPQIKDHFEFLVEEKVQLPFLHPTEAFGTVDVGIIEPFGTLHVIDFKYGQKFVSHKDNSQMMYYALGLAHSRNFDFDQIKTTIYQPRAGERSDRTDSFSVEKLKKWEKKFKEGIDRVENATEDSDLKAGSWCFFCPAKLRCPEISKKSFERANLLFDAPIQPDPKYLTFDQTKTILDRAAYLELWIKEVKDYAENEIRKGKKISGWELKSKKNLRKWKRVDFEELESKYFVDLYERSVKSVAEVEKELKAIGLTKEELEEFFNDNVVSVPSEPTLSQTTNDYDFDGLGDLEVD